MGAPRGGGFFAPARRGRQTLLACSSSRVNERATVAQVLAKLQLAFERKLIFTVGTSTTTGGGNQTTWHGIHHKTSPTGGCHTGRFWKYGRFSSRDAIMPRFWETRTMASRCCKFLGKVGGE